jgi:hypothetical protein
MNLEVGGPWEKSVCTFHFASMCEMRRFDMDLPDGMTSHGDGDGRGHGRSLVSRLSTRFVHLAYYSLNCCCGGVDNHGILS